MRETPSKDGVYSPAVLPSFHLLGSAEVDLSCNKTVRICISTPPLLPAKSSTGSTDTSCVFCARIFIIYFVGVSLDQQTQTDDRQVTRP